MFRNYIKIAWRSLLRNKISSFINIGGLAVGMAVAMLIGLWIYDELNFNKYHENYERIAQVLQNGTYNGEIGTQDEVPPPLGKELRNVYGADFKYVVMSTGVFPMTISYGEKNITKKGNVFEPEAAEMLNLEMLQGTREGLQDFSNILITESLAQSFFGNKDPTGKILKINNDKTYNIAGVYKDLPKNSSFHDMEFILPWNENEPYIKNHIDSWGYNSFETYVQIADHADMAQVSAKIKDIKFNNVDKESQSYKPEMFLHPMSKWHLYSEFKNGKSIGGRITFVWLFGIIGVFVLLLACINFMNLSTARSEKRAKEVGIRKAIGSARGQLIYQFFGESYLVVAISVILSLVIIELMLPFFNQMVDKAIQIPWLNPLFWLIIFSFNLFIGIISGSYPALYLSSFSPIKALKGTFKAGKLATVPRKVLVVVQFTVSVTLIIGTLIVFRQIQFAKDRSVGYAREGLIMLRTAAPDVHDHFDAIRTELKQAGAIEEMAESWSPLTDVNLVLDGYDWEGKDPNLQVALGTELVSHGYGETVGWQIKEGRDFSRNFATDSLAMILNESAVKFMGLKDPIGKIIKTSNFGSTASFQIIGIVEDMLTESPYQPVRPFVYVMYSGKCNYTLLKANPEMGVRSALNKMEPVFKKYNPSAPFDYQFVDEEYAAKFAAEERIGKLASFFAVLAIFISCLGLFGLASFIAEQRTKEIGVRKVLGASVLNIWSLLSKEFVILVMISLLIASPLAYYFMNNWIQNYNYRTEISWWIFASAGLGALLITLLTISFQAIRAAVANPVESLKNE